MNLQKAAHNTLTLVLERSRYGAKRDLCGKTPGHAIWMLKGIQDGYIEGEKAHRWLGYSQAIVVIEGILSLSTCKNINTESDMY